MSDGQDMFAGRYRLGTVIGRGGMGIVYRAQDTHLDRMVALKVIDERAQTDTDARARFVRECQVAAGLMHPNIVPTYDAGDWQGQLYLSMQLVEGPDLGELIRRDGPLAPLRVVGIIEQVAAALDAAHAKGLIHRDIKPSNILILEGRGPGGSDHAYLADFGLMRRGTQRSMVTLDNRMLGTVAYSAPEQLSGRPVTARTDVYSLGCVAYEAFAGTPPFERETSASVIAAQLFEPVPSLTIARPELGPAVAAAVDRAVAKDPDQRYGSTGEFAAALRRVVTGTSAGSGGVETVRLVRAAAPTIQAARTPMPSVPATPAPSHSQSRTRWPVLVVVAVVAFLGTLGAFTILPSDNRGTAEGAGETIRPDIEVPRVRGLSEEDARGQLEELGLQLDQVTTQHHPTVPIDQVLRTDPAVGDRVEPGTTIDMVVSLGPEPQPKDQALQTPDADTRLLTLIPDALAGDCHVRPGVVDLEREVGPEFYPSDDIAAVLCEPDGDVRYYLFASGDDARRHYDGRLATNVRRNDVVENEGDCWAGETAEMRYPPNPDIRLHCYRSLGVARLRWVDEARAVFGGVDPDPDAEISIRELADWWEDNAIE